VNRLAVIALAIAMCAPGCRKKKTVDTEIDVGDPKTLPRLYGEKISEVAIDDGFQKVVLRRADGAWRIAEPLSEPADPLAITAMLGELSMLEWAPDPVAVSRDDWEPYYIGNDQALALSLVSEGKRLPTVYLGNRGHARVGANQDVYPIHRLNRYTFERELRLWRDLGIAKIDRETVTEVSVTDSARKTATARRDGDSWGLVGDVPAGRTFDPEVPAQLVLRLATLRAHDIADGIDRAAAGLSTPRLTITARSGDTETAIELGRDDGDLTYVGVRGAERVWKVKTGGKATIDHGPDAWFMPAQRP
jgi:hypothetical protein